LSESAPGAQAGRAHRVPGIEGAMKKHTIEFSVGIFVLIGLICVGYLTIKLGKMELLGSDFYFIKARFGSVSGLRKGAIVDLAGVEIGKVESVDLDLESMAALVTMKIRANVPLSADSIASIKTSGLIGDKYVKIEPGGDDVLLKDGDELLETESAVDLEAMIGKYAFGSVEN